MDWNNKTILITGGTGSFGNAFVSHALKELNPKVIRIFSRDELKQSEMREKFSDPRLRFFIGDVRDSERLERALRGVDIVIHAAAMKRVEACEYNPFEAVQTNIIGTQNVVAKAIDCGVERVIAVSSDKAVNPVNLYGATKLCQEKIVIQGNSYSGPKRTLLSCVRYGNVVGSRGSVVPLFKKQRETGEITITDVRMTRFWITLTQAVQFVRTSIEMMRGGEIFVPKLPSMKVTDLAEALAPECSVNVTGIRPGEKLHEVMITEDESRHALELSDRYLIQPEFPWWTRERASEGTPVPEGFRYSSDNNSAWIKPEELSALI